MASPTPGVWESLFRRKALKVTGAFADTFLVGYGEKFRHVRSLEPLVDDWG